MINDLLKLLRGVAIVVALFILQRAFFAEFASIDPALASARTQMIVVWAALFLGLAFYAAIDDGDWVFNSFVVLMIVSLISLVFSSYDILSVQRDGVLGDSLFVKSLVALAVALSGGFVGSRARRLTRHWRSFNNQLGKASRDARGLRSFWRGQRTPLDLVFQAGLAVFGQGAYPTLLMSGYVLLSIYLVGLVIAWFRCSPNVSALKLKYASHCIGFPSFAAAVGASFPLLHTAALVTRYVN
jgi:hypothetical protein